MRHVQAYREAHPTRPESNIADVLADLGLRFRREVPLATKAHGRRKWTCLLDFVIDYAGREWVLEVDGAHWHSMPGRDRLDRRKNRLLKRRRIPFLRISDADALTGQARTMIIEFLHLDVNTADADVDAGIPSFASNHIRITPQEDANDYDGFTFDQDSYPALAVALDDIDRTVEFEFDRAVVYA